MSGVFFEITGNNFYIYMVDKRGIVFRSDDGGQYSCSHLISSTIELDIALGAHSVARVTFTSVRATIVNLFIICPAHIFANFTEDRYSFLVDDRVQLRRYSLILNLLFFQSIWTQQFQQVV